MHGTVVPHIQLMLRSGHGTHVNVFIGRAFVISTFDRKFRDYLLALKRNFLHPQPPPNNRVAHPTYMRSCKDTFHQPEGICAKEKHNAQKKIVLAICLGQ